MQSKTGKPGSELEKEEELNFVINAAELATFNLNPQTNKFTGNKRLKELFGLEVDAEIDLNLALNNIVEQDRLKVIDAIQYALNPASGGNYEIEYSVLNPKTNIESRVFAKGKALFEGNKPYRFSGILQDVTKSKKLFASLQQSEKKFRDTIQQAPVGITILKGPDFIAETANESYLQLIDKTEARFIGKPLFESLPEVKAAFSKILTDVLATGTPYYGSEFPVTLNRYGNLQTAYFNFVYQPLKEDGKITGIVVVANDITDMVIAKHNLAESEEKFRNLIMYSPIPKAILRGKDLVIGNR